MLSNIIAIAQNYFHIFLAYTSNLSSDQIVILVAITAVLILFLSYRLGGFGLVTAILIIYLIAYVLYINNIFNLYEQKQAADNRNNKMLEEELNK